MILSVGEKGKTFLFHPSVKLQVKRKYSIFNIHDADVNRDRKSIVVDRPAIYK